MSDLRIVHAGDLDTNEATGLHWRVSDPNGRFQEIAIVGDKVVGAWVYEHPEARGRGTWMRSIRTDVARGFQGRGLATRLWFHGIERWRPTRLIATYVSGQGRVFLARMFAELAYRKPEIFLDVTINKEDHDLVNYERMYSAQRLLNDIGRAVAAKKATPQLTAIAGGKS